MKEESTILKCQNVNNFLNKEWRTSREIWSVVHLGWIAVRFKAATDPLYQFYPSFLPTLSFLSMGIFISLEKPGLFPRFVKE